MTDAMKTRMAEINQLRAGHFPAAFVTALEAYDALPADATPKARRLAACDVRAWYLDARMPVPPALQRACARSTAGAL